MSNIRKLDDLIESLQQIKNTHGGDIPVVYTTDEESDKHSFVEYNPSLRAFTGSDNDTLEVITDAEHEDKGVCSFVAVVIN